MDEGTELDSLMNELHVTDNYEQEEDVDELHVSDNSEQEESVDDSLEATFPSDECGSLITGHMTRVDENACQFEERVEAAVHDWLQSKTAEQKQELITDNYKLQQLVFSLSFKTRKTKTVGCVFLYLFAIVLLKEILRLRINPLSPEVNDKVMEKVFDHLLTLVMLGHFLSATRLFSGGYRAFTRNARINAMLKYIPNMYTVTQSELNEVTSAPGLPVVIWLRDECIEDYNIEPRTGSIDKPTFCCISGTGENREREKIRTMYRTQQREAMQLFSLRRIRIANISLHIIIMTFMAQFTRFYYTHSHIQLHDVTNMLLFSMVTATVFLHTVTTLDYCAQLWLELQGFTHDSRVYNMLDMDRIKQQDMPFLHHRQGVPFMVFLHNIEKYNIPTTKILPWMPKNDSSL